MRQATSLPQPSLVRIHPKLGVEWHAYKLYDGTMYVDPAHPQALDVLSWAKGISPHALAEHLPELGMGKRGVVYGAGDLAIKKCVTDLWSERTGLKAVVANIVLATALSSQPRRVGTMMLAGC